MSRARTVSNVVLVLAFGIICLVLLLYLGVGMGLGVPAQGGYTINAVFASAEGLVPQSEVRIAGVKVGNVTSVTGDGNDTLVTMSIDSGVTIRQDARAVVRPKSPLGEQYVEILRQPGSSAGVLHNGGTIPIADTGQSVQLDSALSELDPATRAAMQTDLRELGAGVQGEARNINTSLPGLDRTVANLRPLAQLGQNDQQQIGQILTDLNTIMGALADEHQALGQIVVSGDNSMSAIAARDSALAGVIQQLATLFTSLDEVFANLTPADRASLEESPSTLQAQERMLELTGPSVDQLIPEILRAQVNYPNNELSITNPASSGLAAEWESNFAQNETPPSGGAHALRIASSLNLLSALCTDLPPQSLQVCNDLTSGSSGGVANHLSPRSAQASQSDVMTFILAAPTS